MLIMEIQLQTELVCKTIRKKETKQYSLVSKIMRLRRYHAVRSTLFV